MSSLSPLSFAIKTGSKVITQTKKQLQNALSHTLNLRNYTKEYTNTSEFSCDCSKVRRCQRNLMQKLTLASPEETETNKYVSKKSDEVACASHEGCNINEGFTNNYRPFRLLGADPGMTKDRNKLRIPEARSFFTAPSSHGSEPPNDKGGKEFATNKVAPEDRANKERIEAFRRRVNIFERHRLYVDNYFYQQIKRNRYYYKDVLQPQNYEPFQVPEVIKYEQLFPEQPPRVLQYYKTKAPYALKKRKYMCGDKNSKQRK